MFASRFFNISLLSISKVYVGLIFALATPFYIKLFGEEVYGLIGFYQLLRLFFFFFDPGLATALNRELAQQASGHTAPTTSHNTLRTIEVITWTVSLLFGISFTALSGLLAKHWFISHHIPANQLQVILIWMGIATSSVWPSMIYGNGLQGLHRQSTESLIQVTAVTLQHLGALVLIYLFDLGMVTYFIWQTVVNCLQTTLLRFKLLSYLPKPLTKPKFSLDIIYSKKHFLTGMSLIFITSFTLSHYDRLFLSAFSSLDIYGAYCLAAVLANLPGCYCHAVHTTFFPRFTGLLESQQLDNLTQEYRLSYELMALGIIPGAVALFFYAPLIVQFLSTGDALFEQHVVSFLYPLLTGSSLFFLVHIPIVMQYAHNCPKLFGKFNLVAALTLIPISLLFAQKWGGQATAFSWSVLGVAYVCIHIPLMHQKILPGELWRWYLHGLLLPLLASLFFVSATYYTIAGWTGLVVGSCLALLATFGLSPTLKPHLYAWANRRP